MIFINYFFWSGAKSRSRNLNIPAPAPAKSFGSLRLRLHNTDLFCSDFDLNVDVMSLGTEEQQQLNQIGEGLFL
jgi:hypothetical protein